MSTTTPWDSARKHTETLIGRYSNGAYNRERAVLRRMDPLNPTSDWDAAAVLYSTGLSGVSPSVELAVATAVHLWATNYSKRNGLPLDESGNRVSTMFGASLRRAAYAKNKGKEMDAGMIRRVSALVRSNTNASLVRHLRSVTVYVESVGVPIDYPNLAADLSTLIRSCGSLSRSSKTFPAWNRSFWQAPQEDEK